MTATVASGAPGLRAFGVPHPTNGARSAALDGSLNEIAQRYPTIDSSHALRDLHQINPAARFRLATPLSTPQVLVDAVTTADPQALKAALQRIGLADAAVYSNDVGGWLPVDQIATASALPGLRFARASMPRTRSSVVATQGDFAQQSSAVRATYPALTGSGVMVGVLSDSFNCMAAYEQSGSGVPASGYNGYAYWGFTATYADDQQASTGQPASSSALPAGVNVVEEAVQDQCLDYGAPYQTPFGDEGRAILQIIHAIAPGASLAFYTAVTSEADFASGIETLANDGAKVIDDDVGYPDEPFFQDGLIAQAINKVAGLGVVYFTSAGNDGTVSYENTTPSFTAGAGAQPGEKLLNFDPSGKTVVSGLSLSIPALYPGEFVYLIVGWDQPYLTGSAGSGGATGSIDMCVTGAGADLVTDPDPKTYPNPVSCTGGSTLGQDPVQTLIIGNPASATAATAAATVTLSIGLVSGTAPGRVKFLLSGDGANVSINSPFAPGGPTIQGHSMAATAASVGAAYFMSTPQCGVSVAQLENYSSEGGDPILFDTSGNRLATPQVRNKPDFVGPDGVNNTILGATLTQSPPPDNQPTNTTIAGCQDVTGMPNFFGTSAAAPHAAAAAALMLQANPALTNTEIIAAMQSAAQPMSARASSAGGYDFDDGHGFLDIKAAFSQLPGAAPTISVSPATITVGSSATLSWTAINSSSCTASGGWSGSQAAGGTQSVTPSATGTATYTLTCTGSNGSVSSSATLTVSAASSGGGHGGGGGLGILTLLSLGGVLLASRRFHRVRLVA